jgi:hypothetical protein
MDKEPNKRVSALDAFGATTLSIMTHSVMAECCYITSAECHPKALHAEYRYAEYSYAECLRAMRSVVLFLTFKKLLETNDVLNYCNNSIIS